MTTFSKLEPEDLQDIQEAAREALNYLATDAIDLTSAQQILGELDKYLLSRCAAVGAGQAPDQNDLDVEQLAFECGCLWGVQFVEFLGWQWIRVAFNSRAPEAVGVASPDASLVIYPFQTIFLYCERVLPVRIARSFEVLTQPGRVPMLPPAGLENVMEHID